MIKELKKIINSKASTRTVLSCIVTATMITTNFVMAKGIDYNNIDIINSSKVGDKNEQHGFIIDAPIKFYQDVKKVEEVTDFKFKVPDFLPEGYKVQGFQLMKISNKDNVLAIIFENKNGILSLQISEQDPAEALKIIESSKFKAIENSKVESIKKPMKLGEINGLSINLTTTLPARKIGEGYLAESKVVSNYFAWKDQKLWYSIEYDSKSNSKENYNDSVELSGDDMQSIVKSLKYQEDIKSINYCIQKYGSQRIKSMNIYDKEDIEQLKTILGFNPKFPLEINKDINITSSVIGIFGSTNINENEISYELNNFYSNKDGSITFNQSKRSSIYDNIKENKYIKSGEKQIQVQELNINNNEVFKYLPKGIVPQVNYLWKENEVYYNVIFFVNVENSDEIIKEFINSKSLE